MDKQYSKQFFSSFVHAIQQVCKTYLDFDEMVEISGYVAVEIDNSQRERYLLCELVHASGNVFSESYCAKAFKTLKPFHQPVKDLVRCRTKRRDREMPDLQIETLIPQKSPCATTSGSECSLGVYRSHAEGTPHDMMCSSDHSREPSPVQARAPLPGVHKRISETQTLRNITKDFSAASDFSASDNAFSRQTLVPESVSCNCDGSQMEDDLGREQTDVLVNGKVSTRGTHIRRVPPGHSDCGQTVVTADQGSLVVKDTVSMRESQDSSVQDTASEMELGSSVPSLKRMHAKRPTASSAQNKCTPLKPKQPAQDIETRQNFSNILTPETSQPSDLPVSAKTVKSAKSHQPKVSLCKITRLERRRSVCKKTMQPGQTSESPQSDPTAYKHASEYKSVGDEHPKCALNVDKSDPKDGGGRVKVDPKDRANISTGDSKDYGKIIRQSENPGQENVKPFVGGTLTAGNDDVHSDSHGKVTLKLPKGSLRLEVDNGSSACMEDDDLPDINFCEDDKDMDDVQEKEIESGAEQFPGDTCNSPTDVDSNLSTAKKTKFHLNLLSNFLQQLGENHPVHTIPCQKLDTYIGTFFATVKRENGEEYGPTSLASIQSSIDRHLRKLQYPYSIKRDAEFHYSRRLLFARQKALTSRGIGQKKVKKIDVITEEEVDTLFIKGQLGTSSADALLNTVWFMNNIHFGVVFSVNHYNLRWGDFELHVDDGGKEYLQMVGKTHDGTSSKRVYANPEDPARCYVNIFKKYKSVRPEETCKHDAPFYLTVNRFHHDDQPWYKFQNVGVNKLGSLMRRMAVAAGLDMKKFTSTAVTLSDKKVE